MRETILNGELPLPGGDALLVEYHEYAELITNLWKALWYNYIKDEGSVNSTYWYDKFNNPRVFNLVIIALSKAGWINSHSIPARNWAEIHLVKDKLIACGVTQEELAQVRANYKYQQYTLGLEASTKASMVKVGSRTTRTGLIREGFRNAGNTQFGYDMPTMDQHKPALVKNLTKSMDKIRKFYPNMRTDIASYDAVSTFIYDYHSNNPEEVFTTGNNINDSRGRAISQCLKKVANPISSKDFRASLIITEE